MAVTSMTGFARASGSLEQIAWNWEIRSVNGRNLDVRCRLPAGYDLLEPEARKRVGQRLRRGSVNVALQVTQQGGVQQVRVNREALVGILAAMRELQQEIEAAPPRLDGILGLRGVLEPVDTTADTGQSEARQRAMLASLDEGLDALLASRRAEGAHLQRAMAGHLDRIAALSKEARQSAAAQPEALRRRLQEQLDLLLQATPSLAEERLAQEAALLAVKADVREELDRLEAHLAAARGLLAEDAPVGRRLEFLAQEFQREANTLCSKSSDVQLTQLGLDLKAVIDQLREQVQNVE